MAVGNLTTDHLGWGDFVNLTGGDDAAALVLTVQLHVEHWFLEKSTNKHLGQRGRPELILPLRKQWVSSDLFLQKELSNVWIAVILQLVCISASSETRVSFAIAFCCEVAEFITLEVHCLTSCFQNKKGLNQYYKKRWLASIHQTAHTAFLLCSTICKPQLHQCSFQSPCCGR